MANWKVKSPMSVSFGKVILDCTTLQKVKKEGRGELCFYTKIRHNVHV
jgi:hypothetical protein